MNILRDPQISDRGPPITPLERDVLKEAYALKPGPIPGVGFANTYLLATLMAHLPVSLMHLYWEQMMGVAQPVEKGALWTVQLKD